MSEFNLQPIKKGDTYELSLSFYEDECETTPIDVSAYVFKLQAKNTSGTVVIEWLDADFVYVNDYTRKVTLAPATTNGYTAGEYPYDLQVTIGANSYTYLNGYVQVLTQVTS
jgi:hypothetical protein